MTDRAPAAAATAVSRRQRARLKAGSVAAAAVLAAMLLILALRGVEWREVLRLVAGADVATLALASVMASVTLMLRALRWRILLNVEAGVTVASAFWATAAGYLGNNVLPARAGELVRTAMISSRGGPAAAYVLATALAERVADTVVLVAVASLVVLTAPVQLGWLEVAMKPAAVLGLAGALLLAFLPLAESAGTSMVARLPLPEALRRRLHATLVEVLRGVRVFHDGPRLLAFAGLTAVIWSMDAIATMIGGAALGFVIPLPAAFLLLATLGLGSALPSTPGYLGIYQFAAVAALTPFGFTRTDAIAYILVAQALMVAVMGLWGSLGLLRYRRTFLDRSAE